MKRITIHDKTTLPAGQSLSETLKNSKNNIQPETLAEQKSDLERVTPYIIEEATLNAHLSRYSVVGKSSPRAPEIQLPPCSYSTPRRFMHIRPADKADSLNAQIDRFADRAASALGVSPNHFGNPGMATPGRITVVGRILGEVEGKLTERGILLESSRQMGSGCRVPLDLGNSSVNFFPGQLVVLEGTNPNGKVFTISSQTAPMLTPPPSVLPSNASLSLMVADGPFTTNKSTPVGSMDFTPFEKLLNLVFEIKPEVLLLMGPFVDSEHPLISSGKLALLPDDAFQKEFMARLRVLTSRMSGIRIVLVPSLRDTVSDPILPQPAYLRETLINPVFDQQSPSIVTLPNPGVLSINGFTVGVCTSDILLPLGMEEYSRASSPDRMERLCSYLFQQGSLFPLHPAPVGTNIDYDLLAELELTLTPHILLLSSQLRYFARTVHGSLVVNAGQFCRRQATGTAALIHCPTGIDRRVDFYQF